MGRVIMAHGQRVCRIAAALSIVVLAPFSFAVAGHADPPARSAPTPDVEAQIATQAGIVRNVNRWNHAVGDNWKAAAAVLAERQRAHDAAVLAETSRKSPTRH